MKQGYVYLVGAGCGTADLITVRGQKLLERCDTVVYDDLIDQALLENLPAERIYVGKRRGRHSAAQDDICEILIRKAREGKRVVRLKGGDPFVFGRGGEEVEALLAAGVPCEEVPGITSAIAIPAEAGIPVTHRGVSQSVHIVTAHTADTEDGLPAYLGELARLPGTLVFLMGLSQLPVLTGRLIAGGKAPETPAAVISGGNATSPADIRGTLADIAEKAKNVKSPAVIVVGEAAALELTCRRERILKNITVGLTGTDIVTGKLRKSLQELGAKTILAERSVIISRPFAAERLCGRKQWLVFTSSNGVRVFFEQLRRQKTDLRGLGQSRFAVIGAATAEELEKHGFIADLCPETYTTERLAQILSENVPDGETICLLRSAQGSVSPFQKLMEKYTVESIPLYETAVDLETTKQAADRLAEMDYLLFSSASGVESYFDAHGRVPEKTVCVCIGDVTAAALKKRYKKEALVAEDASVQRLIQLVQEDVSRKNENFAKRC